MSNPYVTVLMSAYNEEKHIREALESILTQTYRDFEFLIINDGSTDNTPLILEVCKDPRMKIINNESTVGLTASLNRGLELAQGDLIARMDADDIAHSERLEKEVDFLDRHREIGLVGTYYLRIDEKGNVIDEERPISDTVELREKLLEGNRFAHGSVMFRKECVEKVGYYREAFQASQDYDLWLRISEYYEMANIPEFLYKWRLNADSISVSGKAVQDEYAFMAVELARERRKYGRDRLQIMDDGGDEVSIDDVLIYMQGNNRKNSIRGYTHWGNTMLARKRHGIALKLFWAAFIREPFNKEVGQKMVEASKLYGKEIILSTLPEPVVRGLKRLKRTHQSEEKG